MSLSGFDEISVVVFEAGASLTEKAKQEKKKVAECIHFRGVDSWKSNVKERECIVSVSHNGKNERVCAISVSEKCNRMSA